MLLFVWIPPTRFELVSPDPKSCMIDRYTTGVLDDKTSYLTIIRSSDHIPLMSISKHKKALLIFIKLKYIRGVPLRNFTDSGNFGF